VDIIATRSGRGYVITDVNGGLFGFGDAVIGRDGKTIGD
jgi:hypothetical protein